MHGSSKDVCACVSYYPKLFNGQFLSTFGLHVAECYEGFRNNNATQLYKNESKMRQWDAKVENYCGYGQD